MRLRHPSRCDRARSHDRVCCSLLEDPATLYRSASDERRRRLNQAIFTHLFVCNAKMTDSSVTPPLAELLAADAGLHALQATSSESAVASALEAKLTKLGPHNTGAAGSTSGGSVALAKDLYQAVRSRDDCSKHSVVRAVGLEPTSSFEHRHLKPARQPIAPRPRDGDATAFRPARFCRWG